MIKHTAANFSKWSAILYVQVLWILLFYFIFFLSTFYSFRVHKLYKCSLIKFLHFSILSIYNTFYVPMFGPTAAGHEDCGLRPGFKSPDLWNDRSIQFSYPTAVCAGAQLMIFFKSWIDNFSTLPVRNLHNIIVLLLLFKD